VQLLKLIEMFFRNTILDSFLAQTVPATRLVVSIVLSMCVFLNDFLALGIVTTVAVVLIACSLQTVKDNWAIIVLPLAVGILMAIFVKFFPERVVYLGVSPGMLVWRFLLLCLAAAIWLILLPQKDLTTLVRGIPFPQFWVAVMAAFRGVEIGGWILDTVNRTRRTKRLSLLTRPIVWFDGILTAMFSHFIEFLNGFAITLRTRGAESRHEPREGVKRVGAYDILAYVACAFGLAAIWAW